MDFQLIDQNNNIKGVLEKKYIFPNRPELDLDIYLKEYDKHLAHFSLSDKNNCYLFYVEKFPSAITKIRSYKGLLPNFKFANFEKKLSSGESYLGFILKLDKNNISTLFEYFFTPNNCCLIKTRDKDVIENLSRNIFKFNFYNTTNTFWIDYIKLAFMLTNNSSVIHFHVNPENEYELGIREYLIG